MSDTTELDAPLSFVRWLHAQAKGDPGRMMPYSNIYNWGRQIHGILGVDGRYDAEWVALELSRQGATAEDLSALASAEAAWRVDSLVDSAELAGISLDPVSTGTQGADEAVVASSVSEAVEAAEARVLCGYRNHRGEGCIETAVAGAGRCGRHGGAITDPEVRRSFLLVAFAKVIDGSRVAVDALLDVAENGRSEMARVQAAKELLDRAGVQQDQHVHIHRKEEDTSEDELLQALRARMLETKDRLRLTAVEVADGMAIELQDPISEALVPVRYVPNSDSEIVDAVIIEDDDVSA